MIVSGPDRAARRTTWPPRRVTVAALATAIYGLAIGIPTGVVPSPLYTRMTSVLWWNIPIWATSAVLAGLLTATYIRRPADDSPRSGTAAASGGGLLAALSVGCPVCNKLVVALLGASGAMSIWALAQPVLGLLSVLGLAWVLRKRLTSEYACSIGASRPVPVVSDSGQLPPSAEAWARLSYAPQPPSVTGRTIDGLAATTAGAIPQTD